MKLVRNAVSDANDQLKGYKAHFTIECNENNAKDMARLEAVEDALRAMDYATRGDGKVLTWDEHCDGCPLYDEGISSGFWVELDMIEDFKADYKKAKKQA